MSQLRSQMIRDMQLRKFLPSTQKGYLNAVKGLADYYHRSPDTLSSGQIEDYILYLFNDRKMATGSCYAIFSGLRFFYAVTLGRDSSTIPIPPTKKISTLPEILSIEQVEKLFSVTHNPKHRAIIMTAYGGGLRVSEIVKLKVTDIHSDRMVIRIDQGKCRKDRYTLLPKRLLEELRSYWSIKKPKTWLFPGQPKDKPLSSRAAQKAYHIAVKKAGIKRKGGIHTLRHCFATHLLEAGENIRTIQLLMGHRSILTTMRYLQITSKSLKGTQSPLDLMSSQ
jgi:site-specific recombinase XerD